MKTSVAILLALLVAAATPRAGESPATPVTILDLEQGSFRAFLAWKTPSLISSDGVAKPLLEPRQKNQKDEDRKPVPIRESPRPPKGWVGPDFDASAWPRARGQAVVQQALGIGDIHTPGNPAEWNLVCLRGAFRVTDPSQVTDLRLHLRYHGGAVVYVNGKEAARGHLPAGDIGPDTLAERYPEETYVRPDGKLYAAGDGITDAKDFADRIQKRERTLPPKDAPDAVAIPSSLLRAGINVLAIEVHAAPVSELAVSREPSKVTWRGVLSPWPHAGVLEARLTSASGAGLTPNVGPTPGIELSNSPPLETLVAWDYAHPAERIFPMRLIGARNGIFSGKVFLSSAAAIRNLKASASELVRPDGPGRIPAAVIRVRWAEPAAPSTGWNSPERFDRLLPDLPAEIPPSKVTRRGQRHGQPVPAAVAPVWLTVAVPADAVPGLYRGTLAVEAEGAGHARFDVSIELKVHDWIVPEPRDFVVHNNLYQSPDTVARYYQVPLWSDRHWELMGKSFDVLRQVGNKICVLNLIVRTHTLNNTESMIRWVKKAGGGYDYDFAIADKYMDLYAKVCGKPAILQLNLWAHIGKDDKNPPPPHSVTVLDPATGKLESLAQPPYGTPENEAFWKPVLTELRKRLETRGWFDVAAVCYTSYCWGPTPEMVGVYKNIWPDGKWMNCSHSNPNSYAGTQGAMPVPYSEWVWGCGGLYNPDAGAGGGRKYPRPWKRGTARIEVANPRFGVGLVHGMYDGSPLVLFRTVNEAALQGNVRGLGRVGGDFWPLPGAKPGRFESVCDSYGAVGPSNNTRALSSPGPDGAIFNERLEAFREGLQLTEAIILLQKALESKQAAGELAKKIEDLLDERARCYLRTRPNQEGNWMSFECSGWQDRDDRLFALAAEVAKLPPAP